MQTRKFDELISCFNRNVSNMDIDLKYKMQLLGMITAIGLAHEKEMPHWIPVSERLPESKAAYYIVTLESRDQICDLPNDIDIARWDYDHRKGKDSWHWCKERKVIAWMPLPIPYKEKTREGGEKDD